MKKYLIKKLDKGYISCTEINNRLKCIYLNGYLKQTSIFHVPDNLSSCQVTLDKFKADMIEYLKEYENNSFQL